MSRSPGELRYTPDHEWVDFDGVFATVGITDYAAGQLGDVVFVDLPSAGTAIERGTVVGEIESTKSVGELFAPVDGVVEEVNAVVLDDPALLNADPFGAGWLIRVRVEALPDLLDADAYAALTA